MDTDNGTNAELSECDTIDGSMAEMGDRMEEVFSENDADDMEDNEENSSEDDRIGKDTPR